MPKYYRNKNAQSDGYHEVHVDDGSCPTPPMVENRQDLGWHSNCSNAIAYAKSVYGYNSDGCANCVPLCHTR